jgi:hypothetical protein
MKSSNSLIVGTKKILEFFWEIFFFLGGVNSKEKLLKNEKNHQTFQTTKLEGTPPPPPRYVGK